MRYILLGAILALGVASPVRADGDLTAAVAAVYGSRTVDADLHAIAHERVVEISSCDNCMNHDGMRSGTAEVLGYNAGYSNPITKVVSDWQGSGTHDGILSDHSLGRIGCAHRIVDGGHYFVCVLASGGGWSGPTQPPPSGGGGGGGGGGGTLALPDTAMR
jgi:hypothetical protein